MHKGSLSSWTKCTVGEMVDINLWLAYVCVLAEWDSAPDLSGSGIAAVRLPERNVVSIVSLACVPMLGWCLLTCALTDLNAIICGGTGMVRSPGRGVLGMSKGRLPGRLLVARRASGRWLASL